MKGWSLKQTELPLLPFIFFCNRLQPWQKSQRTQPFANRDDVAVSKQGMCRVSSRTVSFLTVD